MEPGFFGQRAVYERILKVHKGNSDYCKIEVIAARLCWSHNLMAGEFDVKLHELKENLYN